MTVVDQGTQTDPFIPDCEQLHENWHNAIAAHKSGNYSKALNELKVRIQKQCRRGQGRAWLSSVLLLRSFPLTDSHHENPHSNTDYFNVCIIFVVMPAFRKDLV
jgi:hypothetical protein